MKRHYVLPNNVHDTEAGMPEYCMFYDAAAADAKFKEYDDDNLALSQAVSKLGARIAELEKAHARYEYVRTLNVPQFRALLIDNLHFNVPFDELVDNAIKNKSLMVSKSP